jgi:hypothetical protein
MARPTVFDKLNHLRILSFRFNNSSPTNNLAKQAVRKLIGATTTASPTHTTTARIQPPQGLAALRQISQTGPIPHTSRPVLHASIRHLSTPPPANVDFHIASTVF